jgi:hypothetical protein
MSELTTERFAPPKAQSLYSGISYSPFAFIQAELSQISSSKNWNVPDHGGTSIYGNSPSTLSPSAYQEPESNLSPRIAARLNELSLLKNGWDEEDALQINSEAVKLARSVLQGLSLVRPFQDPSIVPTFDGYLQLEWHKTSRSLEFEYTPTGWSILGVDLVNTEHPFYNTASSPLNASADLRQFYIWFSIDEPIWPST